MTDVVERVARALYAADPVRVRADAVAWEALPAGFREISRRQARAAIEAMREPTSQMVSAGCDGASIGAETVEEYASPEMVTWAYRAMIDEAMKEPT